MCPRDHGCGVFGLCSPRATEGWRAGLECPDTGHKELGGGTHADARTLRTHRQRRPRAQPGVLTGNVHRRPCAGLQGTLRAAPHTLSARAGGPPHRVGTSERQAWGPAGAVGAGEPVPSLGVSPVPPSSPFQPVSWSQAGVRIRPRRALGHGCCPARWTWAPRHCALLVPHGTSHCSTLVTPA